MRSALFAAAVLTATAASAQEPKGPPQEMARPAQTLTLDEGRKLYDLGVKTGMAQAAVQAAQAEMKPTLDKLAPPKQP